MLRLKLKVNLNMLRLKPQEKEKPGKWDGCNEMLVWTPFSLLFAGLFSMEKGQAGSKEWE